jgi:type I restriction enzyme S subunit
MTRYGLGKYSIENAIVVVPPKAEQAAIAAFLDRETAKIDALIARQERLIAVLQEKRQALISHAVTKGLNPDAPMKESGVEWLGEVPENWQIGRFAYHLRQIETGWTPDSEQRLAQDDEWAVLKVGCVRNGQFFEDEHKALAPGVVVQPDLEVRPGDLLMSRANTLELVGSVGLIRKTRPHLTLSDKTFRLKLMPSMLPEYANYLLRSHAARSQIELQANGASQSMKNIGQDSIRRLVLPVPPVSEQTKIVHWLDDKACGLTEAIERVQGVVMALQERRTALISAAVTGKIDVRALTN